MHTVNTNDVAPLMAVPSYIILCLIYDSCKVGGRGVGHATTSIFFMKCNYLQNNNGVSYGCAMIYFTLNYSSKTKQEDTGPATVPNDFVIKCYYTTNKQKFLTPFKDEEKS